MKWGTVHIFCPICNDPIEYNPNKALATMHHKEWGIVCSKPCFDDGELMYTRMILGKDSD